MSAADTRPPKPTVPPPIDVRTIIALAWLTDPMHRRWVAWRYEWVVNDKGEGKWTKVPFQSNGRKARNNDPSTSGDFPTIWREVERGRFDGIGLMIAGLAGTEFAAIDLDDVRDPQTGQFVDWVKELIEASGSYCEVTPSGAGARILGTAPEIEKLHRLKKLPNGGGGFELYVNAERYITISGQAINGHDKLADITPQIRKLVPGIARPRNMA